ncbi:hypothetical protein FRC10_005771 [Ceratobasidium sp. 414]|nr:hypothetical protein FRC10_005771 [Ceratobasidium sp. 414]
MKPAGYPNQNKCRAQPTQEDEDEVLGVQEAMADISRRNAGSVKRKVPGITTQVPLRRSSRQKSKKSNKALPVPSGQPKMPLPKPKSISQLTSTVRYPPASSDGATCSHLTGPTTHLGRPDGASFECMPPAHRTPAWHAGKLAAEIPSIVERMVEELKGGDPDRQSPCSCCGLAHNIVGVQNPITRAELNTFIGTYYARRYAAHCRMARLAKMRELQEKGKAKSNPGKQDEGTPGRDGDAVQGVAGGPARKRRRQA